MLFSELGTCGFVLKTTFITENTASAQLWPHSLWNYLQLSMTIEAQFVIPTWQVQQRKELWGAAEGEALRERIEEVLEGPELFKVVAKVEHAGGEACCCGHKRLNLAPRHL